jgi:uncharacterized protein HemX
MPCLLSLLLFQVEPSVSAAAEALQKQHGQTSEMLRDYGALVNLLYLLAIVGGLATLGLGYWMIKRGESFSATVQATCLAMIKPLEDAYRIASAERSEKHAQEIRANEINHQAQLRALERQLEIKDKQLEIKDKQISDSNDERRKVTETANNAYREMADVLPPYTQSNSALAKALHDVERVVAEFGAELRKLSQ